MYKNKKDMDKNKIGPCIRFFKIRVNGQDKIGQNKI